MRNIYIIITMALTLLITGCSTTTKSTLLGMSVGVSTGAVTGAIMQKDKKGALLSALAFGVIGGLTGFFTHGALESRDAKVRKETIFNLEKFGVQGMPNGGKFKDSMMQEKSKEVYIFTDNPKFFE